MEKMKLTLRMGKPRNPVATAARQRNAGRHGEYREERRLRRAGKQALDRLLKSGNWKGGDDA